MTKSYDILNMKTKKLIIKGEKKSLGVSCSDIPGECDGSKGLVCQGSFTKTCGYILFPLFFIPNYNYYINYKR